MGAWVRDGGALSTRVENREPGTLSALRTQPLIVDARYLRSHLGAPGIAVVDARVAEFYNGSETGGAHGLAHRTGHIQGARSIPYTLVTDDELLLRPRSELQALFERAGVVAGDTVVGYCHIGQQATAMLFAARLLGHQVRLYDGSFEDWSRSDKNRVAVDEP